MCQEDGGGRKRRVERRRVSHIPGLMHGVIDSGLLPAHCPHFKGKMEGGSRGRRIEGGVYECVRRKGGGRVTLLLRGGEQSCECVDGESLVLSVLISFLSFFYFSLHP